MPINTLRRPGPMGAERRQRWTGHPPLEYRGIIVGERGCIRVRERNVLRYYARTLAHLLASPSRRTH